MIGVFGGKFPINIPHPMHLCHFVTRFVSNLHVEISGKGKFWKKMNSGKEKF